MIPDAFHEEALYKYTSMCNMDVDVFDCEMVGELIRKRWCGGSTGLLMSQIVFLDAKLKHYQPWTLDVP